MPEEAIATTPETTTQETGQAPVSLTARREARINAMKARTTPTSEAAGEEGQVAQSEGSQAPPVAGAEPGADPSSPVASGAGELDERLAAFERAQAAERELHTHRQGARKRDQEFATLAKELEALRPLKAQLESFDDPRAVIRHALSKVPAEQLAELLLEEAEPGTRAVAMAKQTESRVEKELRELKESIEAKDRAREEAIQQEKLLTQAVARCKQLTDDNVARIPLVASLMKRNPGRYRAKIAEHASIVQETGYSPTGDMLANVLLSLEDELADYNDAPVATAPQQTGALTPSTPSSQKPTAAARQAAKGTTITARAQQETGSVVDQRKLPHAERVKRLRDRYDG
jgi:hypothetical protein